MIEKIELMYFVINKITQIIIKMSHAINVWHDDHKSIVFGGPKCVVCWNSISPNAPQHRCDKCQNCVRWLCSKFGLCVIRVPLNNFTNGQVLVCDKCFYAGSIICEPCQIRANKFCTHCGGKYKPIHEPDYPPSDPHGWSCPCTESKRIYDV